MLKTIEIAKKCIAQVNADFHDICSIRFTYSIEPTGVKLRLFVFRGYEDVYNFDLIVDLGMPSIVTLLGPEQERPVWLYIVMVTLINSLRASLQQGGVYSEVLYRSGCSWIL